MNRLFPVRKQLWENLLWGVGWGLFIAAILSCYVTVLYLFRGPRPFQAQGTNVLTVVATYIVGGIAAGVIVGLFRPLGRSDWGAALLGAICGLAVFALIRVSLDGPTHWTRADAFTIVACAILIGAPVGYRYRRIFGGGQWRL